MAKGISSVKGNKLPKVGEENFYEVATYYPGTAALKSYNDIKWKLFVQQSSGSWRELRGLQKTGKRVPYSFPQKWHEKKLLIEAYIHSPEMKSPPGIIVTPVGGEPKIESIGFFDSNWNALKETPKYGQTVQVRINTSNMFGETLKVSLWERDTYSDTGHDESENTNVWDSEKLFKVTNTNGRVEFKMPLDIMWKLKADKGIWDVEGSEHEYYLLVKGKGAKTKFSPQQNVKDENAPVEAPVPARNPSSTPEPSPSPAPKQEPLPVKGVGPNPAPQNDGVSPSEVKEEKVEGITDAYFAKKEYTKQSGKESGTADYIVGSNSNKTKTDAEKEKIAKIILGRVNAKSLKDKKEYTTLAAIKAGLTKDIYNKNEKVTFKTYKLEAEFVRVSSAPLEAKLYLVAKAYFLDGKNAKIIVKEKDGLIKGSANAILPILEITEADMEKTSSSGEVKGTEKTEFTGVIKDGMIKIPIHLRPKSDENLKIWKDKLAKGIKDGDYNYTFGSSTSINDEKTKKNIAGIILKNAISGNVKNKKIADGKIALVEDIEKALTIKTYEEGATIKFPTYKKQAELLYLNAKATGTKQHDKEFLKSEGAYFEVAKKCPRCEKNITVEEFKEMFPDVTEVFSKGTNSITPKTIEVFLNALNNTLKEFKINTCLKKAFFLAQITKETGTFSRIDENLYYTTESALHAFWSRKNQPRLYTNPTEFFKNPERLGNYVYRGVAENGNEASGDGYKYRGRGLIQITRKKGYRRFGEYSGTNLLSNPDLLLEDIDLMTRSAGWYWKHGVLLSNGTEKDLNTVAASGDFKETTRLVHGSTADLTARETILSGIKKVLKTDECQQTQSDADIEYHIQYNGEIQYKIQNEKREFAAYYYHDSTGNIHELGTFKLNKVRDNYGGMYKDKLGKDNSNIFLVDIRIVKNNYRKGSVGFTFTINTNRYYMNDVTLAAYYGAMLNCSYDDFVFNGFSNEKGESIGGSTSHKNGMNGDLRYLRKDKKGGSTDLFNNGELTGWKGLDAERQNNFNDALYKFGWKSMLSQYYGDKKEKLLNHATNDKDNNHNDHLHIQGFKPTLKETT